MVEQTSHHITLCVSDKYDLAAIKLQAEKIWIDQKCIAELVIHISPTNAPDTNADVSPLIQLFQNQQLTLDKIANSQFWLKTSLPDEACFSHFPLFPQVLPVSKLYALLFPNHRCQLLANSFEIFINIQNAYERALEFCTTKNSIKTKVKKQLDKIKNSVTRFSIDTMDMLNPRLPSGQVYQEKYVLMNYYATINMIRIYEYSILDLLLIPDEYQSGFVIQFVDRIKNWQTDLRLNADLVQSCFLDSLLDSWATAYKSLIPKMNSNTITVTDNWPTDQVLEIYCKQSRAFVNIQELCCANRLKCQNRELKSGQFKRCAKCRWARYCSPVCQANDWPRHKLECGKELTEKEAEKILHRRILIIGSENDISS
ncbi:uncharacterized protein LOC126319929 [Schistocerca gregaria]|uniref:uncharacterized protein LOC126319929 n=1 Tax=Schistocerca gregaria TaxID=7010 RepID=UPI00211F1D73|nr:uncharacterized protein LOC126319929 [Schistocerca gregaria]